MFTMMQLNGRSGEEYQSKFIRMYEDDGMLLDSLNEKMYIESEF